jgi:MFS family permease
MTPLKAAARPYGWYYGWNIVAICIVAQIAANALPVNAFSLFLQGWSKQLHTPISTLQLALASCGIGCALISPLIGALSDKYPARWLFGIGLAGIAVFCFGIGFMRASWQLILLYALVLPFALSLATTVPANAVVSRWFVRRLGLALGLTSFGLSFAGIVMPPIVAVALPAIGWRMIWFVAGTVVALVILPLALLVLRDRPGPRDGLGYLTASGTSRPHHGHGHGGKGTLRWRTIVASRNFWLLVIIYLPMLALYGGLGQNLAPIATSRGLSPQMAGMLLSAFSLAQLLATLGGGLLSDRFGNRLPLAGMALVAAAGGVIVAFGHSVAVIGCGTILTGVGGGFWPLLVAAVAVEFGAEGVGRAFGLIIFFLPIAVLAPFAAAKMQESTGSYVPALLTLAAASVLAGLVCLLLREKRQNLVTTGSEPPAAELAVPTD